jgi:competence protein ComEA
VRLSSRRPDDADVIRARLRALLADREHGAGWVPDDPDEFEDEGPTPGPSPISPPAEPSATDPPEGVGRHRAPGPTVRWRAEPRGLRSLWLAGLCAALVLIGWTWWDRPTVEGVSEGPRASASIPSSSAAAPPSMGVVAETSTALVVSVVGLVARPGLVTLPPGSRVADAIEAAGGLLPEADPASVNLAAVVSDGQQVAVGVPGTAPGAAGGAAAPGGKIDLNSATAADLDALPGIGPVLAQRIVDHRMQHGPFRSVDELDDVPGIGPAIFGELADLVVVTGA